MFVEGAVDIRRQRVAKLEDAASKAGCEDQVDRVISAVHNYSLDYHPTLEKELLEVLERSANMDSHAFGVIVDSLDFAAAELKLPHVLRLVPEPNPQLRENIATMKQLRRLGLPLTEDTFGVKAEHLERWDPDLKAYDPSRSDADNNATARPFYYRLLAYNSAVSVPGTMISTEGKPLQPFSPDIAFLVYREHLESFANLHNSFPARFPPPMDEKLDEFLLSLPKHTVEYVKGNGPDGRPYMTREQKLARWYSRVKALGTEIKRKPPDPQGKFAFMD